MCTDNGDDRLPTAREYYEIGSDYLLTDDGAMAPTAHAPILKTDLQECIICSLKGIIPSEVVPLPSTPRGPPFGCDFLRV